MRNLYEAEQHLDVTRDTSRAIGQYYGSHGDDTCGVFDIASPTDRKPLRVVVSSDFGWEHVSVSRPKRCPNWPEMEHVKRLLFRDDEVCFQLHVSVGEHLSVHPNCLHIWRPTDVEIPLPPKWMVGPYEGYEQDLPQETNQ